jgi:hypothetical protein
VLVKCQALEAVHEALGEKVQPSGADRAGPRKASLRAGSRPRAIARRGVRGRRIRRSPDDLAKRRTK